MNKKCIALLLTLSAFSLHAQIDTNRFVTPQDIKSNKTAVTFEESQDHFMFNITMDNMMEGSKDSLYNSNIFNPNFGFYFLYDLPFGKSGLSFAPGLGFTFSKINLDNSIMEQTVNGSSFVQSKNHDLFSTTAKTYDNSSIYNSWIEVPVEFRYRSKPINGRSSIKVALGMRGGLRLASNSKINYIDNQLQNDRTIKESTFTDVSPFRYGATFRIGYGALNLFGYYGLNQFFKDSKNSNNLDLRQYSIGISITGM